MIYERCVSGGWVGFDTQYIKQLRRKVPMLCIGFREGEKPKSKLHIGDYPITEDNRKWRKVGVLLIHKNTEILPDLYKAIGHYLGRKEDASDNTHAYFQHEQMTFTCGGEQTFTNG